MVVRRREYPVPRSRDRGRSRPPQSNVPSDAPVLRTLPQSSLQFVVVVVVLTVFLICSPCGEMHLFLFIAAVLFNFKNCGTILDIF